MTARTYLVVIDHSAEATLAVRYAARRAAQTDGQLLILSVVTPPDFVAFGGVQATLEAEAREEAEQLAAQVAASVASDLSRPPQVLVRRGATEAVVRELLNEQPVSALVLAAAASGAPGPLVDHFTGADCGTLSCAVMIVPGALQIDQLDALS